MCYDPSGGSSSGTASSGSNSSPLTPGRAATGNFALDTITSVVDFIGTNNARKSERQSAAVEFGLNANALTSRSREIKIGDSQRVLNAAITRAAAGGAVSLASAEGGLSALSARRLNQANEVGLGGEMVAGDIQSQFQQQQIVRDLQAATIRRDQRIANAQPRSPFSLILDIAGNASKAATTYATAGAG
jgi:hypothetical protein